MKKTLLTLGLFVGLCTGAIAQPISEDSLSKQLTTTQGSISAIESILKTPDEYSARILYASAGAALKENRIEDSGFLFYAAQLRADFDQICFITKTKESSSPAILYGALSESIGNEIYPSITAQPKVFAKVVSRLRLWKPKAPNNYQPPYKFLTRKTEKEADVIAKPKRTKFINRMIDLSTLLNDKDYFSAFQVIQAYSRTTNDQKPTREAVAKATATMKQIEKDKHLKGTLND